LEIIVQVDDCQMFAESNLGAFLKITDEQKTKIEEITKEKNEAIMKALGFGVDSSGEKDLEKSLKELPKKQYLVFKEANEKVEKSLTSEQRESLDKLKGKKIDLAKLFDEMAENKLDSKKSSDTAPSQPSGKPKLP
jgi:Spy/CpxP family protein refolding chaperone